MMNCFMKPMVQELNELGSAGFTITIDGQIHRFVLRPLMCSVNSFARPILQNGVQFNGYHGVHLAVSISIVAYYS